MSKKPSNKNTVTTSLKIEPDIWKKAKINAMQRDKTVSDYIKGLILKDLREVKK